MKRIERDIVALFNTLWYKDFPLSETRKSNSSRAEWTTHIGICVRSLSDLLGYFTHYEEGIRTDAIIKDNKERAIANIEWEWNQPFKEKVNEIKKLYKIRKTADISIFIGYCENKREKINLERIKKIWRCDDRKLVVFLIKFHREKSIRVFDTLDTYIFTKKIKRARSQPALPWMLQGTRWEHD